MPNRVCVLLRDNHFRMVDRDHTEKFDPRPPWWDLPDGALAINSGAITALSAIESALTGRRTILLGFAGCTVRSGALYHEPTRDLWFLEVAAGHGLALPPPPLRYAELSPDEARAWLSARGYEDAAAIVAPADPTPIPPDRQTRQLPIKEAALLMGKSGKTLQRHIKIGKIVTIKISRQSYIFDTNDFPPHNRPKVAP